MGRTRQAGLYGLDATNSNRDFSRPESYGKNKINTALPVALSLYMESKNMAALCLETDEKSKDYTIRRRSISHIMGSDDIEGRRYSFETAHPGYSHLSEGGRVPGVDLLVSDREGNPLRALEIKLTAIPDAVTSREAASRHGSELVLRPDTIFYLAAALHENNPEHTQKMRRAVKEAGSAGKDIEALDRLKASLVDLATSGLEQTPLLLQPIWRTEGMSSQPAEDFMDLYCWSAPALLMLLATRGSNAGRMSRGERSCIWLALALGGMLDGEEIDFARIVDENTYGAKNDKALSASGRETRGPMKHPHKTRPRIRKEEMRAIILGGASEHLQPERRLDGVLAANPQLFSVRG